MKHANAIGPQAYGYANGSPLKYTDPDGRFVVDKDSLHRCLGAGDKGCAKDRLAEKLERAAAVAKSIVSAPSCGVHFGSSTSMFTKGSGPSIQCDTQEGFSDRFCTEAQRRNGTCFVRPSWAAFTVSSQSAVFVKCETLRASENSIGGILVHEGFHLAGNSHFPAPSSANFDMMSFGCGIPRGHQ